MTKLLHKCIVFLTIDLNFMFILYMGKERKIKKLRQKG